MTWFVYILLCDQKTYYVGITHDLDQGVHSHKSKLNIGTEEFSDIRLVYQEKYSSWSIAERRETQLKGWTFAKKKALIESKIDLLKQLSKNSELIDGPAG